MEFPPDRLLWRHGECAAEGAVCIVDGQIGLEHEDAVTDRLHDMPWIDVARDSGSGFPSDDGTHPRRQKIGSRSEAETGLLPEATLNLSREVVGNLHY
jgi:hypothetical protein